MAGAMVERGKAHQSRPLDSVSVSDDDVDDFDEDGSISSFDDTEEISDRRRRSDSESGSDESADEPRPSKKKKERKSQGSSQPGQTYRMKPLEKLAGPKPYKCDLCQNHFQEKKSVYRHIKEVHKMQLVFLNEDGNELRAANGYSCQFVGCGEPFSNKKQLDKHAKKHQQVVVNGKRPSIQSDSDGPKKKKQKSVKFNGVPLAIAAPKSESSHTENGPKKGAQYRCVAPNNCSKTFASRDKMVQHLQSVHGLTMLLVNEAEQRRLNHVPDKKFSCGFPGCLSSFTRGSRMREHIQNKHPDFDPNTFVQSSVSKSVPLALTSSNNKKASAHSTSHSPPEKSHSSSGGSTLYPKKYACDYPGCDKAYTKSSHVKRHKQSAHEKEPRVPLGPKLAPTLKAPKAAPSAKSAPSRKDEKLKSKDTYPCLEGNCQHVYTRKSDLTKHVNKVHGLGAKQQPADSSKESIPTSPSNFSDSGSDDSVAS